MATFNVPWWKKGFALLVAVRNLAAKRRRGEWGPIREGDPPRRVRHDEFTLRMPPEASARVVQMPGYDRVIYSAFGVDLGEIVARNGRQGPFEFYLYRRAWA